MKKFNFVEPIKIEVRYPNVKSVYDEDNPDVEADFFSFANGVHVDNKTVQGWVNDCVRKLLDDPENHYSYHHSGNTLVIATRNSEEINVFVSRSHMQATIPFYEYTYYDEEETM
jgi:hypothetical protein